MRGRAFTFRYSDPDRSLNGLFFRLAINSVGLMLAGVIVPGIEVGDWQSVVAGAALLTLVNTLLKPIATVASFCLIVLSLGLFLIVVNATMLVVTAWLSGQIGLNLTVDGFGSAVGGALVLSLVTLVSNVLLGRVTARDQCQEHG